MEEKIRNCLKCNSAICLTNKGGVCIHCLGKENAIRNKNILTKIHQNRKGKTYEEIYGIEKANEIKLNKSKSLTPEVKQKIALGVKKAIQEGRLRGFKQGDKLSEEAKQKMSNVRKGKYCGKNNPFYGKTHSPEVINKISKTWFNSEGTSQNPHWKKHTDESIAKMSQSHRGLQALDKHPLWQGGKSFEPYTLDFNTAFKESIRDRDNYCCVVCNKPQEELGYKLHIHHIDYDKKNSFPQNCISLCRPCHINTNFNRTTWKSFFQTLLKERYQYEYTLDQKIILDFTQEISQ